MNIVKSVLHITHTRTPHLMRMVRWHLGDVLIAETLETVSMDVEMIMDEDNNGPEDFVLKKERSIPITKEEALTHNAPPRVPPTPMTINELYWIANEAERRVDFCIERPDHVLVDIIIGAYQEWIRQGRPSVKY